MQQKQHALASLLKVGVCAIVALGFVAQVQAQEKKVDGTWTWTRPGRNGGPDVKMSLKLKTEGDKITGKVISPGRDGATTETEIKDAKLKGDELSFTVVREFGGNTVTMKYSGKLSGDTIKGKIETERDGNTQSRDWEAKRETEKTEKK